MSECQHDFRYQGEVTWAGTHALPGTGARARYYASAYHCTKCCGLRLHSERQLGNTYEKVKFDAVEFERKPASVA